MILKMYVTNFTHLLNEATHLTETYTKESRYFRPQKYCTRYTYSVHGIKYS